LQFSSICRRALDGRLTLVCHAGAERYRGVRSTKFRRYSEDGSAVDKIQLNILYPQEPCSYLLRLWHGGDGGLRASLQSVQTGERHMFANLESLLAFLAALSC
jgi:hypothetical protein